MFLFLADVVLVVRVVRVVLVRGLFVDGASRTPHIIVIPNSLFAFPRIKNWDIYLWPKC